MEKKLQIQINTLEPKDSSGFEAITKYEYDKLRTQEIKNQELVSFVEPTNHENYPEQSQRFDKFSRLIILAACRNYDTKLFFPDKDDSEDLAKEICNDCPIRISCLNFAINNNEKEGIWGGMNAAQRIKIKNERILAGNN
jgi:WhiB family redox-sensing transcriptional regulator